MNTKIKTPAQKLRKEINCLIKFKASLASLRVSDFALDAMQTAIDELEDAYIAEVNAENSAK